MADEGWAPLRDELAADVRRVSDRLRTLSLARLRGAVDAGPGSPSRAAAARAVAQQLADVTAALEVAAERRMPVLGDLAAGDQLAVAGHDLLAALDLQPDPARRPEVAQAVARLADLRRRL